MRHAGTLSLMGVGGFRQWYWLCRVKEDIGYEVWSLFFDGLHVMYIAIRVKLEFRCCHDSHARFIFPMINIKCQLCSQAVSNTRKPAVQSRLWFCSNLCGRSRIRNGDMILLGSITSMSHGNTHFHVCCSQKVHIYLDDIERGILKVIYIFINIAM